MAILHHAEMHHTKPLEGLQACLEAVLVKQP